MIGGVTIGWFFKNEGARAVPEARAEPVGETAEAIIDPVLFGLLPNEYITRAQALSLPSLAGCVEFIASSVAMLPIKLYAEVGGKVEEIKGDKRIFLLNDDTGDKLDGFQFKKALVRDYLLDGNGYAYINKRLNTVQSLHYVDCRQVAINTGVDPIFKSYNILVNGRIYRDFEFVKILRNTTNGALGVGIVEENQKAISLAYHSLVYEEKLVKAGGCRKGFLLSEKKLLMPIMEELKKAWKKLFSNSEENVIVLNEGIKFQEASNSSVEMQLNENKKTNSADICKLFTLSPKLLDGDASYEEHTTSVKLAVIPVLSAIEAALNKDLLLEDEKSEKYFAFDTKELLKGDILKRYQAYKMAIEANFMQIDDVRCSEDLPALGLEFIKLGLNDVLYYPQTKEIYTPNTNAKINMKAIEGGEKTE